MLVSSVFFDQNLPSPGGEHEVGGSVAERHLDVDIVNDEAEQIQT